MVFKLEWSAVLAFVAMVLSVLAANMPEPYGPFLQATSAFVTALSVLLVALGVITFVKLVQKKLKM